MPAARRRSAAWAPSSLTARRTARPARPWRRKRPARSPLAGRTAPPSREPLRPPICRSCSSAGASDRNALHPQRRLADADRHALAVLAAGADAGIEREIVADHGDAMQVGRPVADQHGALEGRAELAVLDSVGLGALE